MKEYENRGRFTVYFTGPQSHDNVKDLIAISLGMQNETTKISSCDNAFYTDEIKAKVESKAETKAKDDKKIPSTS
jgi:hypothetical protein